MNGNSTQNPIITSPDLLDLKLYPKDPLYNFGSKIRDTDNEVFFTDSHVCSCCGSCHWGGDRGDYFVNTILRSKNQNYFSTTQVLANENSYDKNPDKPIVVGGVVFPEQVCFYTVSLFLRNISSSKYIGAKLETKSVTCALCPKTASWFILQHCTTRSEFVFCFQFTSSSNLSYTLRLSTEYLERARLISIVKFQQNKSNNFKV